ncbi:hypothetical protein Poly30_02140 [Planctomycetes bacterium Poly30]|uniref:DUF6268 domain-containing protein n=2 Tax=Saltatorellus ferox TaxID=2528018 RepID=A0A518EL08_9BACT|nr:hypothetical protein Poly30_02140 [Planctomycetes bacterium Poly30]
MMGSCASSVPSRVVAPQPIFRLETVRQETARTTKPVDESPKRAQRAWEFETRAFAVPSASAGSIDSRVSRFGASLTWNLRVTERTTAAVKLETERSSYKFDGLQAALPGFDLRRVDGLDVHRASVNFMHIRSKETSYFVGAGAAVAQEPGAAFEDSSVFNFQVGMRHAWNDSLSTSIGVAASTRIEEDLFALPFLGLDWTATDSWSFQFGVPATGVKFRASDSVSVALRARFEFRDFRLEDSGAMPGGILRDEGIGVELGLDWRPSPAISLGVNAGYLMNRELRFDDASGATLLEVHPDSSPFAGLSLKYQI